MHTHTYTHTSIPSPYSSTACAPPSQASESASSCSHPGVSGRPLVSSTCALVLPDHSNSSLGQLVPVLVLVQRRGVVQVAHHCCRCSCRCRCRYPVQGHCCLRQQQRHRRRRHPPMQTRSSETRLWWLVVVWYGRCVVAKQGLGLGLGLALELGLGLGLELRLCAHHMTSHDMTSRHSGGGCNAEQRNKHTRNVAKQGSETGKQ